MEPKMHGEMVREEIKMNGTAGSLQTEFTATIKKNTRFARNRFYTESKEKSVEKRNEQSFFDDKKEAEDWIRK